MQYLFRRERCSVLLQKHQHFFAFNIIVFKQPMSTFWSVLDSERWQRFNKDWTLISVGFWEIFADFGSKMAQTWPQKVEKIRVLLTSDSFSEFCWDWKIVRWKLRIALDDWTRSTARFQREIYIFCAREFPQKDPNYAIRKFSIFFYILGSFCTIIEWLKKILRIQQCQQGLILVSSSCFEDIFAIFGWNWSLSTPKSIQQQKRTFFDKLFLIFVQPRTFL